MDMRGKRVADDYFISIRKKRGANLRTTEGIQERLCNGCKLWLPVINFHKKRNYLGGSISTQAKCKECSKTYYKRLNQKRKTQKKRLSLFRA